MESKAEKYGKAIGFILMYFIFTTLLYFLLKILDKIPKNYNYIHIIVITLMIVLLGGLIKLKIEDGY